MPWDNRAMTRGVLLAGCGIGGFVSAAAAQAPQIPRFESGVDLVSVPVAVTLKDGEFVTGLEVEDFRILEDGVEQEIVVFGAGLEESWVELPPEEKEELSMRQVIGLLLDSSGSMEEDLQLLQEAAIKFLTNIPRTEHLFVISFDESIWLSEYSSDDQRIISNRIYEIEAEGWTALYDAVATFLDRVYDYEGRKTLAVFSDGEDSRSTLMFSEALDLVKLGDTTIHSIHFGDRSRHDRVFHNARFLRAIADATGGSYALASSLDPARRTLRPHPRRVVQPVQPGVHLYEYPGARDATGASRSRSSAPTSTRSKSAPAAATTVPSSPLSRGYARSRVRRRSDGAGRGFAAARAPGPARGRRGDTAGVGAGRPRSPVERRTRSGRKKVETRPMGAQGALSGVVSWESPCHPLAPGNASPILT